MFESVINFAQVEIYGRLEKVLEMKVIDFILQYTYAMIGGILFFVSLSKFLTASIDLDGKHVLVTGGSSGIGLKAAELYANSGANVTIVARNQGKLDKAMESVQKICESKGRVAKSISLDTSIEKDVDEKLGELKVDVLINCAGISIAGNFENLKPSDFENMLKTNVLGSVYPTRVLLPGMKSRGGGRIVFVASQVAQVAIHGYTAYAASKWALRGLAEALQMEVKPYGILVSVCYPPDTDTPGYEKEMESKPDITKVLSDSGEVFSAESVAHDIIKYSGQGYFGISTGFDGWLLKQLHPGMSPINNLWEVWQGIIFAPLARFISLFYVASWDAACAQRLKKELAEKKKQ